MKNKFWIFILFFISAGIRLLSNFSQELIPGVNGGYYPLQVRSVLINGHLGFSDMPLLFYLDAFIVKCISIFGFAVADPLILMVVKIVDSIALPLLLLPLYRIIHLSRPSTIVEVSILAFSVLSFSPLMLVSDLQKNALAIVFVLYSIAYYLSFQSGKKAVDQYLSIVCLLLTGLTHFGTFVFGLFLLLFCVLHTYKKKAVIPMAVLVATGLGMVLLVDRSRFDRLVSFWSVIFERPAILHGMLSPPDFLIIVFSIVLGAIGFIILGSKNNNLQPFQNSMLFASAVCLFTFSFPFLDGEYFKRLSLFLFIPQVLLILQISEAIGVKNQRRLGVFLFLLTFLSISAITGRPKETVLDNKAYQDLKKLRSVIVRGDETIIIARHGLEWWAGWAFRTKVGQDKAINKGFFEKYQNVIFIRQTKGLSTDPHGTPFHEPRIPESAVNIFSSEYFKAYQWRRNH